MSDLSLLTGVYANIEKYGVLIDRVIERLGREKADPTDPDQKKLAQLFVDASDQGLESQSSEALTLDSLLRTSSGKPLADLKQLGERLQKGDVDQAYLRQLGELAQGLEQERADIARRLRKR
ncbi:MAG: hypothetical protein F4X14_18265 [Caldilineaceae bacterium SB0661_bin_32]|uniref:Uncharacterized protein n=1 Tax=Caldilineaceae bacterium SB0661_bin_32 TaxID=2605255 RepID=A0A6B1DBF1_9CHLR|nr:hypothetical protein [Caldilineaceae bacterium SB0661_bin_32]